MRCHIPGERSTEQYRRENLKTLMASEINDIRLCWHRAKGSSFVFCYLP